MLKGSPDREDQRKKQRMWLYWTLFAIVAAFVLWAIAFTGRDDMSAQASTRNEPMTVQPLGAHAETFAV
ncbi:hypothetical protein M2281_001366 [Mesorhizobium soli]|nr:hypothetical protein [Mesorhizobium soli]